MRAFHLKNQFMLQHDDSARASVQATKLARAMVTKYGMSEALGKVAINYDDNGRSVSSETRNLVETEVCSRAQKVLHLLEPSFTLYCSRGCFLNLCYKRLELRGIICVMSQKGFFKVRLCVSFVLVCKMQR